MSARRSNCAGATSSFPNSVRLTVGGAALIRGDFLKTAPNATLEGDTYFGYTEFLFTF